FGSNTVSVRLNDGTGNFTAPATNPNPAVGSNPYSVALGDVDGDGDLDVLTANFNGNTVSVRLNDGAGNFTAPATNPNPTVDSGPQSVVLGDVDGDGDLDLLTANFNFGGTVSVRLNDGTGNFTAPATNPNPAVGNLPIGLALGDVDGDGDLDLLTTNSYDNTVSVRLNDGTGSFTAPATNPNPTVGSGPQSVALSDVDGDGDLDMLTANADDNTVSVRLNDGTGNFTAPATNPNPAVGNNPSGLALGDVDGDGDLDVLTANFDDNTVSVRLNQPPAPVLSSLSASSAAAGGALTLSGTLLTGATLVTFTNTSTGAATTVAASAFTSTGYAATPQTIGLLVPAGLAGGAYSVSVTTPGGTSNALLLTVRLQVTALSPAANARAAARNTTVGLTFSGPIDAATAGNIRVFSAQYRGRRTATASTSGNTVTLTPTASSGAASFQPGETVRVSVPATVQGTGGAAAGPYVYQFTTAVGGTGRGNFRAPATNPNPGVGSNSFSVAVGDVDGDGDLDMLTANGGDNTVSVRLNDGAGNFTAPAINPNPAVGFNPKSIAVGDVDGDGDLDLLTANSGTNIVSVRLNDGTGNFTPPATNPSPAVGSGPLSVALGDVDGDGDLDLLTANYLNNTVSVRLNDGTGNFTPPATNPDPAVGSNPTSVAVGDVDGDGDLDMLTANASDNTVSVRLNDGTGNFTPPATNPNPAVGSSPNSVALADVDGDGDLDLLTANGNFGSSGTVSVRLNDGTGNFTPPATNPNPAVGSYPQSLAVGDVDGDGDLDLLTANRGDNTVSVRLNDGTGNFAALAANASPGVGSSPTGVALGDVDGDGDLDLLAANYGASTVSVRLNQPPAPVLSSLSASSAAAGGALTLSGTFLAGATLATFTNTSTGAATTVAAGAFTSTGYAASPQTIGLLVPAGLAAGSYTVSVTTPNGTSNALPLTVCVLTVAVQNVSVPLGASGTVSVPASAFNNGSTSTCGPVTAQVSSQGTVTGQVNENGLLTLTAPAGAVFTAVTFASYGTPTYANGTYALGSCHAPSSQSVVEAVALGQHTFSISAENVVFGGDPCPNTFKQLVVQATYTNAPAPQLTYSCNSVGTFPVLVTLTDANGTSQQAPATVTVTVPAATSTTWTGTASPDWTDCQNWSYGRLPSATIDAVVPGGLVNYPVLASSTGAVQNLLVASGASLTVATGATLEVTGDFTTNGPVSLAGTISLTGSAPVQALSSPAAFSTLLVDKAVGTVVLQRNLAVGSALTLASGTLATGSFQVVLGSAATLTESNTAYVTGAIATTRPLAAGTAESFGGLGLTLTPATGSTSPGSTAVVRTTGTALRGAGTSQSILRYFDIQPATNSGLNVTLDLSYLDHERNGIAAASVALFKSVNGVGGPWQAQLPITISGNTVRKTGITDFSVWTLGSAANPLPVELTTFTAEAQGTTALLRWTTASEHNSDHFEVEASADGTAFGRIGTVAAQGSSLTAHAYRFVDAQLAGYGSPQVYYRLRQVDLDGTFAYSPVRVVAVGSSSQAGFQVYPTLRAAGEPLRYVLAGALAGQAAGAELTVYTTTGQQVSAQHLAAGATGLVALPPLPTGWYLVRLRTADGTAFSARFGVQ
ncbi:MAG: FG-GAP-like repeat-containing protein, partial [Janthinobacterium lividum]